LINKQKFKGAEGVSIIIPVYNEEDAIDDVVDSVIKAVAKTSYDQEIIVVDDGSTDRTSEILAKKDVKVIRHQDNCGYGSALKTGLRNSQYGLIAIIDADGSYPSREIPRLMENLQDADMVVGARTGEKVNIPILRKPAKYLLNKLANYLSGAKIPDLNSGLRIIRKEVINKYLHLLPNGFSFTTTITLALTTNGHLVNYLPINYHKREGRSKIRPFYDTLNFLQLIIRTILYFNPLKFFLPISGGLFFIGLIFLMYRIFIAKAFITVIIILFVSAFQILAIGMLADLIDKRMR